MDADGSIPLETFPEAVRELRERISHLVEKFEEALLNKDKNYLFFIGLTDNGKTSDKDFVINLENTLNRLCPNKNYTLVIIVPRKRYSEELEALNTDNVKVRRIRKFGTQRCNDISTDMFGWAKIFREFLGQDDVWSFYFRLQQHRLKRIVNAVKKRLGL